MPYGDQSREYPEPEGQPLPPKRSGKDEKPEYRKVSKKMKGRKGMHRGMKKKAKKRSRRY